MTNFYDFSVYVIENGHPVLDDKGEALKIASKDIENEERFWSVVPDISKRYTLFLARKK